VEARLDALPFGLPGAPTDLLAYSEILYYISDRELAVWIGWSPRCGRGHLLAVHWLLWAADRSTLVLTSRHSYRCVRTKFLTTMATATYATSHQRRCLAGMRRAVVTSQTANGRSVRFRFGQS